MQKTHDSVKSIKDTHPMGWKGVFFAYPLKDLFKTRALVISLILTLVVCGFSMVSLHTSTEMLVILSNENISVFPNLLGFNLSAYAIIVGFSGFDLMRTMMRPQKNKRFSLFQETSSIFAFSILVQSVVLITSFVISSLDKINPVNVFGLLDFLELIINRLSIILLPMLVFLSIYAIVLIPFIVFNIFSFGQMNHALLNIQELKEPKKVGESIK